MSKFQIFISRLEDVVLGIFMVLLALGGFGLVVFFLLKAFE